MPIELNTERENLLIVRASGKLTKEDYMAFLPQVEQLIQGHQPISIVFDMHDFHGWDVAAAWEDTKFAFHHFSDIERIAVIGEKPWQKAMTLVCMPFTRAEVRFYTRAQSEQAHRWLLGRATAQ